MGYKIKKIYLWEDLVWPKAEPITTPWVYHNESLWLISVSWDWVNWMTVADRDLWASSYWWTWKLYQRWNNYAFPRNSTLTTSSTKPSVSWYWPGNYYSSSTFITWATSSFWWATNNTNLWWWDTWTFEAMRWPCAEWWHVPKADEWDRFFRLWSMTWAWTYNTSKTTAMSSHPLKLTTSWRYNSSWTWTSSYEYYWMADWAVIDWYFMIPIFWIVLTVWQMVQAWVNWQDLWSWLPIRPFKNVPVIPTAGRTVISSWQAQTTVNETFNTPLSTDSTTWRTNVFMIPYDWNYTITCKWAWSNTSKWWLWEWTFHLNTWDIVYIMVWQSWSSVADTDKQAYWFGWKANLAWRQWWWMSAVRFDTGWSDYNWIDYRTWNSKLPDVVWWWAWGWKSSWQWGVWWGTTWGTWTWSYWTAWAWWTQSWHWSWGNASTYQCYWWDWSWTYWYGWGWGWRWGNWNVWDGSWDDDKGAGWGSGYVTSTATNPVLAQRWGSAAWVHGVVTIVSA